MRNETVRIRYIPGGHLGRECSSTFTVIVVAVTDIAGPTGSGLVSEHLPQRHQFAYELCSSRQCASKSTRRDDDSCAAQRTGQTRAGREVHSSQTRHAEHVETRKHLGLLTEQLGAELTGGQLVRYVVHTSHVCNKKAVLSQEYRVLSFH